MRKSNLYMRYMMTEAVRQVSLPRRRLVDKTPTDFTAMDRQSIMEHHLEAWAEIAEAQRILGERTVLEAINYVDADAKVVCKGLLDDFYRHPVSVRKMGRNVTCHCGSGVKFKRCCGG